MKKLHPDVPLGLGLLILMGAAYHISNTFVYAESTAIFPKITIAVIAILSVLILVQGITKTKEQCNADSPEKRGPSFLQRYGKPLLIYGSFVFYLMIFYVINFFVATAIMLVGLMLYFGVRSWKVLVFVPVGFLAVSYLVFVNILSVKLL